MASAAEQFQKWQPPEDTGEFDRAYSLLVDRVLAPRPLNYGIWHVDLPAEELAAINFEEYR